MTLPGLPPGIERALLEALAEDDLPAPPAGLLDRIRARIEREGGHMITVRAAQRPWIALCPGVEAKLLLEERHVRTWLARLEKGASLAPHVHEGDEECVVLEGTVDLNGTLLGPGDYQLARAGSSHRTVTSSTGCVMLVKSYAPAIT